jgi:hypothetical protein
VTNERDELRESWFGTPVRVSGVPVVVRERSHGATFVMGGALGAIGGVCGLLLAGAIDGRRVESHLSIAARVGSAIGSSPTLGMAIAAGIGVIAGGLLALVMHHSARFIARAIFGATASATIWFCVHLALVARHRPTLPLPPMLGAAALFGLFVALVPPARR